MDPLLSIFNLRPIEIELYKALLYGGTMSASHLAKQVNISRTSSYDLLDHLIEVGLVSETIKGGIKMFAVQSPAKVKILIDEKEKEIRLAQKSLELLQKQYLVKNKSIVPKLQLFEGRPALQQMMKDLLLYRDMTVYVYWPISKIITLLSSSFLTKFHQERVARNIKIKVIWPSQQIPSIKKFPYLKISKDLLREVRIAPLDIDFSLGYTIYGHTVRFISSSKESFGFLVESEELAEMMKSQFKAIWKIAKPY